MERYGGYEYKSRIRSMLTRFGFPESEQGKTIDTLSGGERTRLALVRLLLVEPDILILDEPTNHLDTDTLYWLEEHLRSYPKTLLLVSHDRYFLVVQTFFIISQKTKNREYVPKMEGKGVIDGRLVRDYPGERVTWTMVTAVEAVRRGRILDICWRASK